MENYIRLTGINNNNPIDNILNKIKNNTVMLGGKDGLCNVNQGLRTGADKLSNKHLKDFPNLGNLGDGIFILTQDELSTLNLSDIELKNIVKQLYKNSDIYKFTTKHDAKNFLFYIDKTLNEINFSNLYPRIYTHLNKFKNLMIKIRAKNNEKIDYWFSLDRARNEDIFTNNKIIVPQRSRSNTFGYNEIPWYASADVYFITNKLTVDIELKYILALLNSKLYFQWLYHRGKRKGEMLELYQKPLSEIPIKVISKQDQQPFISMVDKIIKQKENNENTTDLEIKLDNMIYELYGLSEEEIKIVENQLL